MTKTLTFAAWALVFAGIRLCAAAQGEAHARPIDAHTSKLIVHVSKAGLFSAFGDNHEIEVAISEGSVDEGAGRVRFDVESSRMKVLDPQLSPDKRQQVQERMLGPDVLDVARFPRIKFESISVQQLGPGRLQLRGQLSLHGVTRPLIVNVQTGNGHYTGNAILKQRDFGITPVTIAGGTVKVKDELKVEFDIRTNTQSAVVPK